MTQAINTEKSLQILEEIKTEISKPGSILCLAKCVEIVKMLTDDANPINLEELTEAILQDTFLTTKVLQYANSAQYNRSGKRISTVSQCVILLGLAVIRSIVLSVLLLEEYPNESRAEGIRNRGMIAAFGGSMARTIATKTKYASPEHAFLASAFCQFGKLLVYSYLPVRAAQFENLVKNEGKDDVAAGLEIFGMRLETLGKKIGEYLTLPRTITCYMDPFDLDQEDQKEANSSVLGIAHASYDICNIVESSTDTHELEQRLGQCASLRKTGINPSDFLDTFRASLDDVHQYYPVTSGTASAFWDNLDKLSGNVKARKDEARSKGIADLQGPDLYVFTDGVSTVSGLLGGGTLRSVLAATCETLLLGFGARNVALFAHRHSKNDMVGVVAFGPHARFLEKMSFPMGSPTHELHYAAIYSGKNISISKDDVGKFAANTPVWIKSLNPSSFLILPIIHDGNRLGLIYVDGANLIPDLSIFTRLMGEVDKLKYYAGLKLHSQGLDWN